MSTQQVPRRLSMGLSKFNFEREIYGWALICIIISDSVTIASSCTVQYTIRILYVYWVLNTVRAVQYTEYSTWWVEWPKIVNLLFWFILYFRKYIKWETQKYKGLKKFWFLYSYLLFLLFSTIFNLTYYFYYFPTIFDKEVTILKIFYIIYKT